MAIKASTIRGGKLLVATSLLLGMLTTTSYAYTQQEQQMCTGDALRLCGADIPDVDRITACMIKKYDQLSEGCNAVFELPPATPRTPVTYSSPTKPSKPLNPTPGPKRG